MSNVNFTDGDLRLLQIKTSHRKIYSPFILFIYVNS